MTYAEKLEKKGIRRYETYPATVISSGRNGCLMKVDGVSTDIFLRQSYPADTGLYISFDISSSGFLPVVEWVSEYGEICRKAA